VRTIGLSDMTLKTEVPCRSRCDTYVKEPSQLKAPSAKNMSKLAALLPVIVTATKIKSCSCVIKGIVSILFLKNGLKKFCRKNYKNHLRSNNYEVCTSVARCFPNILDVVVLENII
jgi:hypothetical protein